MQQLEDLEIKLNVLQEAFFEYVKRKKFIHQRECAVFWASPISIKGNLMRFVQAGILKENPDVFGRFDYNA